MCLINVCEYTIVQMYVNEKAYSYCKEHPVCMEPNLSER